MKRQFKLPFAFVKENLGMAWVIARWNGAVAIWYFSLVPVRIKLEGSVTTR